jgi:hypothetical protein
LCTGTYTPEGVHDDDVDRPPYDEHGEVPVESMSAASLRRARGIAIGRDIVWCVR